MAMLIDANELKSVITEDWFLDILLTQTGKHDMAKKLVDMIDSVPLAYNVEKVVEQLEDMKKEETEGCSTIKGKYCSEYKFCGCCIIDRAINIVRRGGVE